MKMLQTWNVTALIALAASMSVTMAQAPDQILWTFDRLDNIGGVKTTVEGAPRIIDTPLGKALEFDGVDDAVWIEKHPLAGAATFTFEAIFRPDGGAFEQRWFHLAERDRRPASWPPPIIRRPGRMPIRDSCSSCALSITSGISMLSSTVPATTRR